MIKNVFIFGIIALLIPLSACVKTESLQRLTVHAVWEGTPSTRTAIQADGKTVWWSPSESINLFYGSAYGGKFTSTNTEPAEEAQFTGTLIALSGYSADANIPEFYWAIYPYQESNAFDGNSVTLTVPAIQQAASGTFANNLFPAIAKSSNTNLLFHNVCGGAVFVVATEGIKSVVFQSIGGEPLVGKVKVSLDTDGIPVIDEVSGGSSVVRVNAPDGGTFETGTEYYAVFLPQTLSEGLSITYEKDGASAVAKIERSVVVHRSLFGAITNLDEIAFTPVEVPLTEVDLGLSVKWANLNLGAARPEDAGAYYAWGEVTTKESFHWGNYLWSDGVDGLGYPLNITKYNRIDHKVYLANTDDAASVQLGGKWRTPTEKEVSELLEQCTWTFVSNYEGTGISGYQVTGSTQESIFLPLSGWYRFDAPTTLRTPNQSAGYWVSRRDSEPNAALQLYLEADATHTVVANMRSNGYSIRPVSGEWIAVSAVSLNHETLQLTEGDTESLTATITPSNAMCDVIVWASSDEFVVTVEEGVVTAHVAGTATITAISPENGESATCAVTVSPLVIPVTSVTLDRTSVPMTEGDNVTLVATVTPDNATSRTVSWESSAPGVASVDQNGKVTAVSAGTATITASAGGKSATCAVTVSPLVIPVTSVTLDRTSVPMTEGDNVTLVATVTPDNATSRTVSWESSASGVASVDQNGKVTAVSAGTATITASAGGKSATCAVTVSPLVIPVTSVTLDRTSVPMTEGDNVTLVATVTPDNATSRTVSWESSAPGVASVDQNGKVTAVSAGTATITASAGGKSATCAVTVSPLVIPVTSVTLDRTSVPMTEGDNVTLVATVTPDNATSRTVSWESSASGVASVDQNGKVTAVSAGTATITASAGGKSATCAVTVSPLVIPVSSVTLDRTSVPMTEGDNVTLVATVTPDNATNRTVSWESSTPGVASVDQNGKVTAVSAGTATITASAGGKSATCAVAVSPLVIPVTSVSLDRTSVPMTEGDNVILVATVTPDNATSRTVSWESSVPGVASVDQNGKVTAVSAGTATITASAGGRSATCAVTVSPLVIPVTSVTLNRTSVPMTEGDNVSLVATVIPDNATSRTVSWESSAPGIASVDQNGKVTAVSAGTATITASADGKSATCAVSVVEKIIAITLSPNVSSSLTGRTFVSGDRAGAYVVDAGSSLIASGNRYDNVRLDYSTTWTASQDMSWKNKSTGATVYVYTPFGSVSNASAIAFNTIADQSAESSFKASDFLWGKTTVSTPTESTVSVPVKSIMGELVATLQPGDGFTAESLAAANVEMKLLGLKTSATVNLSNGAVTANGSGVTVTPFKSGSQYRAIVVPQTIAEGTNLFQVIVDGVTYTQSAACTIESGKQTTLTVTISKSSSGINIKIGDWESDGQDHGGIAH